MNRTRTKPTIIPKVIGETLFLYGLLGWFDGILIQFIHPEWLLLQLSHLTPWLRADTFTIASFFVSAIGFLIWQLSKELQR